MLWGTERGCVVLDQPQHAASSRRLRTSNALRLVFDTAALRSNGAGRGIRGMLLPHSCENPCTGSGVLWSLAGKLSTTVARVAANSRILVSTQVPPAFNQSRSITSYQLP